MRERHFASFVFFASSSSFVIRAVFYISAILLSARGCLLQVQVKKTSYFLCFLLLYFYLVIMAPREQVKSNIFESRVDEGMLEWFRRRFSIPSDYILSVTDKKVHEPYTSFERLIVYQDQMKGGL